MSDQAIAPWVAPTRQVIPGRAARIGVFIVSLIVLLGIAEYLLRAFPIALLPPPSRIGLAFAHGGRGFWMPLLTTLRDLFAGLAFGAGTGIGLALLLARFTSLQSIVRPYLVLLAATPMLALVPLLAQMPSAGLGPRFVTALACGPIVMLATFAGFARVDPLQVTLARLLGASARQSFAAASLPQLLPAAIIGFGAGALLGLVTTVGAEMIDGQRGAGRLLLAASPSQAPAFFATLLVLAAIGLIVAGTPLWIGRRWARRLAG